MKIRSFLALAAVAASGAALLAPSTASAWECPRFTQPYDVALPNGKVVRACTPYLSCETCFAVTP